MSGSGVPAWGAEPNDHAWRVATDMYGPVTQGVHGYLRDTGVTPADFEQLRDHFGDDHASLCQWVSEHLTDAGNYNSYYADRDLADRHRQDS